tara:strand:+ start:706 stop:3849 length:3144 start_codon:yes stop_codon:yes gene_type:complete
MTNSFQPQAQPVDTYVQPQSTDLDVLARALKAVNPGIEAFLDNKMDEAIKEEQAIGINQELEKEGLKLLDDGSFGKVASKIRKKDGDEVANEVIGGSIFARKAAERMRSQLAILGLKTSLETEDNTPFDTGEVDPDGQPIFKSISEFAPDSPVFLERRQNQLNTALSKLEGVSPTIITEYFTSKLPTLLSDYTIRQTKRHKLFLFDDYIGNTSNVLDKGSQLAISGDTDELKTLFSDHFNGLHKLGVTGEPLQRHIRDTLQNIYAIPDRLIAKGGGPISMKNAELLPELLAENIPWGRGGTKNLTEHPDYIDMQADHELNFNKKRLNEKKVEKELEEFDRKDQIEEAMKGIWGIKVTNEKGEIDLELLKTQQDAYQKLKDENPEFATEIDELGRSDNAELVRRINLIKNQMRNGFYGDNINKADTDIDIIFAEHATMDTAAIESKTKLKEYAREIMPKIGNMLKTSIKEVMRPINTTLGISPFGALGTNENNKKSIRMELKIQKELSTWFDNYTLKDEKGNTVKDENGNPKQALPSQDEIDAKILQLQEQGLAYLEVLNQAKIDAKYPTGEKGSYTNIFKSMELTGGSNTNLGGKNKPTNDMFESGSLQTQQQGNKPTPTQTNNQTTKTETEVKKEEEVLSSILPAEYNKLDESQKELYEPVRKATRRGSRIVAYVPTEDGEYDYQGSGIRDYLEDKKIKALFGFETGKGNKKDNEALRTEVQTTPIYDKGVLEQQVKRLEELARKFPEGISWEELSVGSDFRLRKRSEIDFEAINVILNRTGLTPKEFFESQMNAHEVQIPTGLFDKLFPPIKENITINEFNKLSNEEKQNYEFKLKKNDKQASSILDKGTLIAGELQPGILDQENNSKQQLEKQMLDVIHSGESTLDTKAGGYEAFNQGGAKEGEEVLGFSGTYGDHPANKGKKLVNMTIQEILDIQDSGYDFEKYPDTPEGQAKWEASGGIHAAGRYQFIRSGLRDAMELAGIKPKEKFTPETQDKLAIALLVNRGPDWWVSMKGNKELKELLEKYKKTDWTKSSTIDRRPDIA